MITDTRLHFRSGFLKVISLVQKRSFDNHVLSLTVLQGIKQHLLSS